MHLDPGQFAAHWSFLLDSEGSVLYGNDWQDNGDGTFTSSGMADIEAPLASEIANEPAGFYVNIHNGEFAAGAVRGQLADVVQG